MNRVADLILFSYKGRFRGILLFQGLFLFFYSLMTGLIHLQQCVNKFIYTICRILYYYVNGLAYAMEAL